MESNFRRNQLLCLRICNIFGVIYVFGLIFTLFYVGCYKICPNLDPNSCSTPFYVGFLIIFELIFNFFCFHFYGKRLNNVEFLSKSNISSFIASKNGKFCEKCRKMTPHRAYHCSLCKFCVLKKDHHCFMMGACVGYGNLRFFIVFLFWASIGAIYGLYYIMRYLGPILNRNFFAYAAPVALSKYLIGNFDSLANLGIIFLLNFTFMGLVACSTFLILQIAFVVNDRTMYERMKGLDYSTTKFADYRRRLRQIFGRNFALNFLCPVFFYRQELDPCFSRFIDEFELKCV